MSYRLGLAAAVALVVVTRIGWTTSPVHRTFDDGVYLASVDAMAAGGAPFRDVFSSQGPLWLPLLRAADLLGGDQRWTPRLVPLAAAVTLVLVGAALARRLRGPAAGLIAAGLLATSGSLFFSTAALASDSAAAAFGAAAVLAVVALSPARAPVALGVLAAAALAIKSLYAIPPLAMAVYVLIGAQGWRSSVRAVVVGAATGIVLALPWGLPVVWDQYVGLHLASHHRLNPVRNVRGVARRFWRDDVVLVALAAATVAGRVFQLLTGRPSRPGASRSDPIAHLPAAAWLGLAASVAVLAVTAPIQLQHATVLVFPTALLVAIHRPPAVAIALVTLLLLPGQADRSGWRATAPPRRASEAEVLEQLARSVPPGAAVVTDDPGLAWQARRVVPGPVVDPSHVRLSARSLTVDDVARAAGDPDVCAVVVWSGRFDRLDGLGDRLDGYQRRPIDGGVVFVRRTCAT